MTTVDKAFRVKNGLVVEGNSATVNGNQVLTTASSIDSLQDVNTSGVQETNLLAYYSGQWIPTASSSVQGPAGVQGIQGTFGPQGIQGTTGIQGIQGIIGDDGFVAQANAPTNTSVLWLDTDEPAEVSGVNQIIAGTNVTISPVGGTGVVTINATGGGGGGNAGDDDQTILPVQIFS